MSGEMGVPFLGSIPLDPQLLRCCERGESYVAKFPNGPAVQPFLAVVESTSLSLSPSPFCFLSIHTLGDESLTAFSAVFFFEQGSSKPLHYTRKRRRHLIQWVLTRSKFDTTLSGDCSTSPPKK